MADWEYLLRRFEKALQPWAEVGGFDGTMDAAAVHHDLAAQGYSLVITARSEIEFAYAVQAVHLLITDSNLRRETPLHNVLRNSFAVARWHGASEEQCWTSVWPQLVEDLGGSVWERARNSAVSTLLLENRLRKAAVKRLGADYGKFLSTTFVDRATGAWRHLPQIRYILRQTSNYPSEFLCWDAFDLVRYQALRTLFLGTRTSPHLGDWLDASRNGAGFAMLWNGIAVVLAMPAVTVDERDRLHSSAGPSISWNPAGSRHFYWHGIEVPEKVILSPERLTRLDFTSETNSEVRRAMAERIGWERLVKLVYARPIDVWRDEATQCSYELLDLEGDGRTARLLKMESPRLKDGTQPIYLEPVPWTLESCRAARKWQFRNPDGTWPDVRECNAAPALEFDAET